MKHWEYGPLKVSRNQRYLVNGEKPFFWLGDTAWLLFQQLDEREAYTYLRNRAEKGYTVIQAVFLHNVNDSVSGRREVCWAVDIQNPEYWAHCDKVIQIARQLGMYMALLPSWGSMVKEKVITEENAERYISFLANRYREYPNIIWLLGGDVRGSAAPELFEQEGILLKQLNPDQIVGFHPFGRTSSSQWFQDAGWLDFNMFQSGHRRYDQVSLNAWDDSAKSEEYYGEDNWRYVARDHSLPTVKPTVDGEPSYEWILQGLHDTSQPYWQSWDVRRYAYWAVFEGAMGHTYGDNAIIQFYKDPSKPGAYGVKETWDESMHHAGAGQMKWLKDLMESVDYQNGKPAPELLSMPNGERYERISIFAGDAFLFAYDYLGLPFELKLTPLLGRRLAAYWMDPSSGGFSYFADVTGRKSLKACPPLRYSDGNDWVLVVVEEQTEGRFKKDNPHLFSRF